MKQLILDIEEGKLPFFMELINNLDFVKIRESEPSKEEVLGELRQAVEEMKLVKQGKLKPISSKELLDEL